MGRSVMTLNGAEAIAYLTFEDPSEHAGLGKHWRQQVAARFESIGTLSKTGTFSNGTSAYSEAGA